MQNLRDKLLKAGKISKRDKKRGDQNARRQRRKKKGHVVAQEAQQKRQSLVDEQRAAQKQAELQRAEEERQQRRAHEQRLRAAHIIGFYSSPLRKGRQSWHFVNRLGRIDRVACSDEVAWQLEKGEVAIVERPEIHKETDPSRVVLVPGKVAAELWTIDPELVRFWNRGAEPQARTWEEGPLGDDPV